MWNRCLIFVKITFWPDRRISINTAIRAYDKEDVKKWSFSGVLTNGTKNVINIYSKCDQKVGKNEWNCDNGQTHSRVTRNLHFLQIPSPQNSYRIIVQPFRRDDTSEFLLTNQLKFEIGQIRSTSRLLLLENNGQQGSCDTLRLLDSKLPSIYQ